MHRTLQVSIGGLVLGLGTALGASPASAQEVDCTDEEVAAVYPDVCIEPEPIVDGDTDAGSGGGTPGVDAETPVAGGDADGGGAGGGTGGTVSDNAASPSSLPFTGGEVLLLSLTGGSALAAGAILVVAGKRRSTTV